MCGSKGRCSSVVGGSKERCSSVVFGSEKKCCVTVHVVLSNLTVETDVCRMGQSTAPCDNTTWGSPTRQGKTCCLVAWGSRLPHSTGSGKTCCRTWQSTATCDKTRRVVECRYNMTRHVVLSSVLSTCKSTSLFIEIRQDNMPWRGGGLGSRPIFKTFNEPYAPW